MSTTALLHEANRINLDATSCLDTLIRQAFSEDMPSGDLSTEGLFNNADTVVKAIISSQQPLVVSGLQAAKRAFELCDPTLRFDTLIDDGDCVASNTPLCQIEGSIIGILKAERVALNLLQHLCGIATLTYQYVSTVSQTKAQIAHTRKTHPGLRFLETQAVVDGGGIRHRQSLSEFVMLKDNHIAAFGGNIVSAVAKVRSHLEAQGVVCKIEVECDTLSQVDEALSAKADVILLDNMSVDTLRSAVKRIKGRAVTEASGGVNLKTVRQIAETGVDVISTSQITLSAPAADIHLELS